MNKLYAICTREAHASAIHLFHSQYGSHYIDLPDGRILLTASFQSEWCEEQFSAISGVEILPDPAIQGNQPLKKEHQDATAHLNPAGKTVVDLARAAGTVHPLMKLRPWL